LAVGLLTFSAVAEGADRIRLGPSSATPGKPVPGTITEMSATSVTTEQGSDKKTIPVNEIDAISYDGEPTDLTSARNQFIAGKYDEAQERLNKIDVGALKRPEMQQDVEFYKGMCAARLALYGSRAEKDLLAAARQLLGFITNNASNYHYFDACETIGDLLAAMNNPKSEVYYNKLAAAPWPEYRMRASVLIGRALTAQKKYPDAIAKFEEVISTPGKEGERQRLAALLGKATALAGQAKVEAAIKLLNDVIEKADPENKELHARAYNARGNCYVAASKLPPEKVGGRTAMENKQHALTDFLHVDLLYNSFPDQHAEALANLSVLWKDVNKGRRAEDAHAELLRSYPDSPWARQPLK